MASFPFDQTLVPNVLADPNFQSTGIYIGKSTGIHYGVIDPRRHNINVWKKMRNFLGMSVFGYTGSIRIMGSHVYSNGPMMGLRNLPSKILGWVIGRWIPNGPIFMKKAWVDGPVPVPPNNGFFERTGQGSIKSYSIGAGLPAAPDEAIGGLVPFVVAGAAQFSGSARAIICSPGLSCWGLIPFALPLDAQWESTVPYLEGSTPQKIDGLIVAAASNDPNAMMTFPGCLVTVGVTEAVAMDGSDSVIFGSGTINMIDCVFSKDRIQEYGLGCF